jgi:uncharacterized membrane protein
MKAKTALISVMWLSLAGLLFSGYLSYIELFHRYCALGVGTCSNVGGLPACVYGFVMYLIVFVISILGVRAKN